MFSNAHWVEVTIGAGSNGKAQPKPFNDLTTGEGSTAMGFYNMQQGDVPYFKQLADNYTISDNFHQSVQGGSHWLSVRSRGLKRIS